MTWVTLHADSSWERQILVRTIFMAYFLRHNRWQDCPVKVSSPLFPLMPHDASLHLTLRSWLWLQRQ
jgi:hypothetical protein